MHRHPYFDLQLHTDEELQSILQAEIVERATLHEWPLSCVQRLTTSDGARAIYKSQFGPTVEPQFYAEARSDLLVPARTIYQAEGYACMLLEFVDAPLLEDLHLSEDDTVRVGRALTAQIGAIDGHVNHFCDVSTEEKWRARMSEVLSNLHDLVAQGTFRAVDGETIRRLERWAFCSPVLYALGQSPGCVHGDLGGDNIFALPDGYRVIDWQRPIRGPRDLDLATLLETSGYDPYRHVDAGIVWMMYLLRIQWLVQCTVRWFPEAYQTYDRSVAQLALSIGEPTC